jgi:hypothetical protein
MASSHDPGEISIFRGEVVEVKDKQGMWWLVKKSNGRTGSGSVSFSYSSSTLTRIVVPSNYLQIL